jgi:hypothetical protein
MKLFCVVLLTCISLVSTAQATDHYVAPPMASGHGWIFHTPGEELKKAANSFFTGVLLEGGGVILISSGASSQTNPNRGLISLGGLMLIAGPVFNILAWVHIKHAGTLMDMSAKKLSVGGTKHGLGLIYYL